jgi:type VI secretion system FHA domain protein
MSLSIKISKKVDGRSDMIASRSWPQNKISIGRGEECTLVLEDPKKHVSRVHVELEEKYEGTFQLTVVSKVNPVFVNGKKEAPGGRIVLSAGDRFELGEYELEMLAPPKTDYKANTPVSDVEETTRPDNPMLQMPKAAAEKPVQENTVPVETVERKPAHAPVAVPAEPATVEEPAFELDQLPPVEPGIFDEPEAAETPAAVPEPEGDVFAEATFVGTSAAPPSNIFDEATYVGSRPPRQGAAPAGVAARSGGDDGGMRAAVQAFLDGAGLQEKEIADAEIEAFLLQSGKILRAAVEGAMALLAARATAKKELRAEDRTMVASKDNNPLKLMSDPQEALAFLFEIKDRTGGFLDPVQAVGDAFDDLRAHEVALFAGMRAALIGSIQRFDPKTLEAELEKNAGGLGLNRKAKLWEQFAAFQQKLARDAEDDFNKVFGREFMGTYMEQVKRLRGNR